MLEPGRDVRSALGEQQPIVGRGHLRVDHRGQRLDVGVDQLGGVERLPRGRGDHHRIRFPDIAQPLPGEDRAFERSVEIAAGHLDGTRRELVRQIEVTRGVHPRDARASRAPSSMPSTVSTTACGKMERTNTARSAPGTSMLST